DVVGRVVVAKSVDLRVTRLVGKHQARRLRGRLRLRQRHARSVTGPDTPRERKRGGNDGEMTVHRGFLSQDHDLDVRSRQATPSASSDPAANRYAALRSSDDERDARGEPALDCGRSDDIASPGSSAGISPSSANASCWTWSCWLAIPGFGWVCGCGLGFGGFGFGCGGGGGGA